MSVLMVQMVIRFVIGGFIVSPFAVLADVLKPKSFAGLFGAAPSVALATLGLAIIADGKTLVAIEARSMIGGAAVFLIYASFCKFLMKRRSVQAVPATISGVALWLGCAFGI